LVSVAPEIYLVIETTDAAAAAAADSLAAIMSTESIASVLIRGAEGATLSAPSLKTLISTAQKGGAAALVSGDASLVRIVKADGVHIPWSKDVVAHFKAAREELGARFIAGADAGRMRHDAMLLGELGADYLGFGIPSFVEDRDKAEERQVELIGWWSEIFEVPCVAFDVGTPQQARALAAAGADFISITLTSALAASEALGRVRDLVSAFDRNEVAQ
jgi:thiamine-phosphate pyrophosphorylase